MNRRTRLCGVVVAAALSAILHGPAPTASANDDVLPAILELLKDPDRELRSLALQRIRDGLEGAAVTQTLVEVFPTLSTEAQADLLVALGERGDKTARPAMLDAMESPVVEVRVAALRAAASLGEAADVSLLVRRLTGTNQPETAAARSTLERLRSEGVDEALLAEFQQAPPQLRVELIDLLVARETTAGAPLLLAAAEGTDPDVRTAALAALGSLAGPEHVPALVRLLLATDDRAERGVLERNMMFACQQIDDHDRRAQPLLDVLSEVSEDCRLVLLSTLGRIGGAAAYQEVHAAIADRNPRRREAGIVALCNWPDASVAPHLLRFAQGAEERGQRIRAVRALMRVSVLTDQRSDAQRLALLKRALALATRDEEIVLALERARAVRTIESLRFVVPYLSKPEFAEAASATVVELAHHRDLRLPNRSEFDKALDLVIATSTNAQVVDRAERYRKDQTH